jgi:WD40 repeat protein
MSAPNIESARFSDNTLRGPGSPCDGEELPKVARGIGSARFSRRPAAVLSRQTKLLETVLVHFARDAVSGASLLPLKGHTGGVTAAPFSPDGTRIATASSDNSARLWDATTGSVVAVLLGHQGTVSDAEFSPDGTHLVTASLDRTTWLWRIFPNTQSLIDTANAAIKAAMPSPLTDEEHDKFF